MPTPWMICAFALMLLAAATLAPAVLERVMLGGVVGGVLAGLTGVIGYAGYSLTALALRVDATATCITVPTLAAGLAAAARHRTAPEPADAGDDEGEDGGGGGQRRPSPGRPPDPGPDGDLRPDWDGFDAARRDWERTPALHA